VKQANWVLMPVLMSSRQGAAVVHLLHLQVLDAPHLPVLLLLLLMACPHQPSHGSCMEELLPAPTSCQF
jgi:hypothetical protein